MSSDLGLLIIRVVFGLYLAGHGAQKLFGWFEGPGLKQFSGFMQMSGLRPAPFWGLMGGLSEFGGGLLLALGLLSPLGELAGIAAMIMAIVMVHLQNGPWAQKNGWELALAYLTVALALALTGPGAYSLDAALGIALPEPITLVVGLVLVVLGVGAALLGRAQPAIASQKGKA